MATPNLTPRNHQEGNIGTSLKNWLKGWFTSIFVSGTITDGVNDVTVSEIRNQIDNPTTPDADQIQTNVSGQTVQDHIDNTSNPHSVDKTDVGLSNVDNVQQMPLSYLDTDDALTADSDVKVPSQSAIKSYVDGLLSANDAMVFKGVIDCSANPNYPSASAGHTYRISVAGKLGGASGESVEVGDIAICTVDGSASGDQATVGANWVIIQVNIDGAVVAKSPFSSVSGNLPKYSGTTGRIIEDSGIAVSEVTALKVANITFIIDGGGSAITTGIKGDVLVPFGCVINEVTLLANQSGSIVVNIWKDTYNNFPPTVDDKITASAPPTIATATKSQDSTLTGWTTAITAGDILRFNVDSVTDIQRVTVILKVTRT